MIMTTENTVSRTSVGAALPVSISETMSASSMTVTAIVRTSVPTGSPVTMRDLFGVIDGGENRRHEQRNQQDCYGDAQADRTRNLRRNPLLSRLRRAQPDKRQRPGPDRRSRRVDH